MRTFLRRCLPLPWLLRVRRFCYLPLDLGRRVLGRHNPSVPPRWLRFVGDGDFATIGERLVAHCRRLAGLAPEEAVLDVGCGAGRVAQALTRYLDPAGRYDGFDVVADAVRWCRRRIGAQHANFHFRHVDVRNGGYNPRGGATAANFIFPYADASFDFVFAGSVFTHMLPPEVAQYLREIRRVLRPSGRCLTTFFVLNAESQALLAAGGGSVAFPHKGDGYCSSRADYPEDAVAYCEDELRDLFAGAGLTIREPIHPGSWCGRARALEGQDMIVAYA